MKNKHFVLPTLILSFFAILFFPHNASAATVPNTIKVKAAFEGVWQCLYTGAYNESFMASKGGAGMLKKNGSGDAVKLPYGLTDAGDNNTNCKEILKGFGDNARSDDKLNSGLMKSGIWSSSDITEVKNYFAGTSNEGKPGTMGYKAIGAGNVDSGQSTSKLTIKFDTNKLTGETCRKKSGSTTLVGTQSFYNESGKTFSDLVFPTITKNKSGNWFLGDVASDSAGINVPVPGSGDSVFYYFCNDDSYIQIMDSGSQSSPFYSVVVTFTQYYLDPLSNTIQSSVQSYGVPSEYVTADGSKGWDYTANTRLFTGSVAEGKVEEAGNFDDYELKYLGSSGTVDEAKTIMMRTVAKINATNPAGYSISLGSNPNYDALKLDDKEIYALYTYYVKDVFKYPVLCEGDANFSSYNDTNSKKINWVSGKTCRIDTSAAAAAPANSVYGIDNSTKHFTKQVSINDVIDALNALPADISTKVDSGESGGTVPGGDTPEGGEAAGGGTTEQENICAQAAGALTWIVCPVLQGLGKTVTDIYDMIEESFLRVDVGFMATSGPTYQTWEKFQSLANIAFAIILLVVILSQITGFGISNYGIKKILPSLIMVAVLVNISFFLCQFAVDISNILGYEFRDRLLQFSSGITIDSAFGNGGAGAIVGSIIGGLFATVAVSGVVKILLLNFTAWIWPFLVSLLGVVIGILFFFIILGLRQVGIISLVVLSPLAIICYALPNTKSLFDRWRKMFTSLLVVYPICGLLMGGGQFVSKLLLKNVMDSSSPTAFMASTLFGAVDNSISYFFYVIVALAIQVVPFFFIPNIVKSSMAAMGNIGAKISSFGSGLSKASTGAIRKSEGYKDKVERGKASAARGRIGRQNWREGLRKKGALGRVGAFVAGGAGESIHSVTRNGLTKAGEKLEGVKGLGWAGRGMTAMGKGMTAAHNQRQSRLQTMDMDQQVKDAKAGYAAGGDYQQRLQNRLDSEHEKYIGGMAEDIEKANVNIANDEDALKARHADALTALNANPESDEAQATVRAYQKMLNANGDSGRRALFDNFAQDLHNNGGVARAGTKKAADHLMRDHAKDIKPNSRDFFGMLGAINDGESHSWGFSTFTDKKGNTHWSSAEQAVKSVGGYDSAGFAKADDATFDRYIQQASNGGGFDPEESTMLEQYTREALDGQHNIHVQGKVAGKMNQLRQALGYATITPGTVQVSGNSGGTGDSGPIQIHNNSAPMPEGFHEAPGSNIIIGGDVSGERIRQFQRQMDQHNNRNNGNGPIIRP